MLLAISSCESKDKNGQHPNGLEHVTEFPPFITPAEEYFDVRLGDIPSLPGDAYQLKITGAIENPVTLSLEDLRNLDLFERTLTIECIHNPVNEFPLRVLFPGYYGVRQPGWIVEMELMDTEYEDYFNLYRTDSSIAVDSKIFFPVNNEQFNVGETIKFGGTAYGGRRISRIEISGDDGDTWTTAAITDSLDQDHVWVFWEVDFMPRSTGTITIHARAAAEDGRIQPKIDDDIFDGINAWPSVTITVEEDS